MTTPTNMTTRLDAGLEQRLDNIGAATTRSKSCLAAEAIREFVDLVEWQVRETQQAVAEADGENFASDQQVANVFAKWGVNPSEAE